MRSKGFILRTPLIMGLMAGLIVAGIVAAFIIRTQTFEGTATLVVGPLGDETAPELGFYIGGGKTDAVEFEDVREGDEITKVVIIKNVGNAGARILVSGNYSPNDCPINGTETRDKIETRGHSDSGLEYYYGVYVPDGKVEESSEHPGYYDLTTLGTDDGDDEKKIKFFVKFPIQDGAPEEGRTDISFEYLFKLEKI